jgi:pimeloyl-ACP methyl ester carboxylesterase
MRSVTTQDGRSLAYEVWGDPEGTPAFALHGTPGTRLNRHPWQDRVAALGARVITYDRPGYGQSTRHPGRRVVDCVADVAAIADDLGLGRFAITGGSGGGPHCLAVAALLGDRVTFARCVVGVAPYGVQGLDWFEGMDPENVKEFGWALAGEEVLRPELAAEADRMLARVAVDPATLLGDFDLSAADRAVLADPAIQQVIAEATREMFAHGVDGWVDDDLAFTVDWGFDLAQIAVPVEVHYGATDVMVPPGHGAWLGEHVPGARVVVVEDAGHLLGPEESLDMLASLIAAG